MVHAHKDGQKRADHADGHTEALGRQTTPEALGAFAGGVGVEEGCRNSREDDDKDAGDADAHFPDTGRKAVCDSGHGDTEADGVHPAGDDGVDGCGGGGGRHGTLSVLRIVRDERQPGEGHRHGKLECRPEDAARDTFDGFNSLSFRPAREKPDAEEYSQGEEQGHRYRVDAAYAAEADEYPSRHKDADADGKKREGHARQKF